MRVSVALCTYNGESYISEQIQSILGQSRPVDEIIISDDGSRDKTLQIAESLLCQTNIDYAILRNEPSKGVAGNFLSALKRATGDYIFTCDQDDVWFPNKVARFLEEVEKAPADLYFSDGVLVDGNCNALGSNLWISNGIVYENITAAPLFHTLIKNPIVTGAAMLVSKKLVDRVPTVPEHWLHDEWFAVTAALSDSIVAIPETTFYYRQHGKNVVGAKRKTLMDRLGIWMKGFEDLHDYHVLRYKKCIDIDNLAKDTRYTNLIQEALGFWQALVELPSVGRIKGLSVTTGYLQKGYYSRYYSSYRSYIRDAFFVLFSAKRAEER